MCCLDHKPAHWFLHGATVLPASAMLLVDASGQYSWLMATSGHCVLDARLSSVTACWLMAIWMNVAHAVAAHWPHGHMVSASVGIMVTVMVTWAHHSSTGVLLCVV